MQNLKKSGYMGFLEFLLISAVILYGLFKWITIKYDFFEKKNIPYEKPFLCFGNMKGMFFKTESMFHTFVRLHKKFNGEQVYGIFEARAPLTVINDFELLKRITVKDFDHFINHRSLIDEHDDELFGNGLFNMKDQRWKDMRSTLSPAFTGSKMRLMYQFVRDCSEESIKYLKDEIDKNGNEIDLDVKDYFTRYTNDVIASTAFGLKINSFSEPNNQFFLMAKKAVGFSGWQMFKFFLYGSFQTIMKFFKVRIFDEKFAKYFFTIVVESMKYRTAHKIVRPDMINMLMEARNSTENSHNRDWSDIELISQCFIFFIAGFESTAHLLCFATHELMQNPDIQQTLFEEIQQVKAELKGKPLSYEKLQRMKYLDNIVSETLRKWPGILATDRVCSKPYQIKTDNNVIDLNVGDVIWINISGMHHDPNNFPNPEKFDPKRFFDENKNNFNPYAYAPFGLGPRNCIGNRFALMEAKSILYYLVSEFELKPSPKFRFPLQVDEIGFLLRPKGGFWLKFIPRK